MPFEGVKELLDLEFYAGLPGGPTPNDDLDLQLVSLHALEQHGARLTCKELAQEWLEHVFFPFDEYGYALANLRRGLAPPASGWFNNPFTDCMGAPIRSEIWAMIAPGAPHLAAYYAYQDALVDHAGGEGVYGEMFFAAIESAAFLSDHKEHLIEVGLGCIPEDCRTARAIRDLLSWHAQGCTWREARELILGRYGHENFTDAPQNVAFTILGWLYGQDFGDALLKAVNCGYDTDCTGATLGAILGIIAGKDGLPERWAQPVGERVAVSPAIKGFPAPGDLHELTGRTLKVAREVAMAWDLPALIGPDERTAISGNLPDHSGAPVQEAAFRALVEANPHVNRYILPLGSRDGSLELLVDYGRGGPAIGRSQQKMLTFTLSNRSPELWEGMLSLDVPVGWNRVPDQPFSLNAGETLVWEASVWADASVRPCYELALSLHRTHDGSPWNTQTARFSLVAATHWTLRGPSGGADVAAIFPGNRLEIEEALGTQEPGIYRASTTLVNPRARDVRLIVATGAPARVELDGAVLFEDRNEAPFMPAYHRAPESRFGEMHLPVGEHQLVIEVVKGDGPLEVYVLPVAAAATKTPGPYYYLTDVIFV